MLAGFVTKGGVPFKNRRNAFFVLFPKNSSAASGHRRFICPAETAGLEYFGQLPAQRPRR
jgi:hypothetical protein